MNKILSFIILISAPTLVITEVRAQNKYSQCVATCKVTFLGKTFDKSTQLGACDKGCSRANWTGHRRAWTLCDSDFGSVLLTNACREGVSFYPK